MWKRALRQVLLALTALAVGVLCGALSATRKAEPVEPAPRHSDALAHLTVKVASAFRGDCVADAGTCESDGEPLEDARVRVFLQTQGERFALVAEERSDAEGLVRLVSPPGPAWFLVDAPAFGRRSRFQEMEAGDADYSFVLQPTQALRVLVRDEDRRPIPEATVLVHGADALPYVAKTERNGFARFIRVHGPAEHVVAHARGFESATAQIEGDRVELRLQQLGGIQVQVLTAEGAPAGGATVRVGGLQFWPPLQFTADDLGVAQVRGLRRGSYDLKAQLGSEVSPARMGLVLGRGQQRAVQLRLSSGRMVRLRVVEATANEERPIPGAEVVVVEDGLGPFPLEAVTDDEGRAELGPVSLSSVSANVSAEGFVGRSGFELGEDVEDEVVVRLHRTAVLRGRVEDASGEPIQGATIELIGNDMFGSPVAAHASSLAIRSGFFSRALAGNVDGPVGELGVFEVPSPSAVGLFDSLTPWAAEPWRSQADGQFEVNDVPPGRLRLVVRHPEYAETITDAVNVKPGGTAFVRVALQRSSALSGRVEMPDGTAAAGARVDVVARYGTGRRSRMTDESGFFSFSSLPGKVDVLVARPGAPEHFVLEESFELQPGESREVLLSLAAPRVAFRVQVLDELGYNVDDARVSVLSLDPDVPLRETFYVDAEGVGTLADAAGLPVQLEVDAPGLQRHRSRHESLPEELTVRLEPSARVEGRVTHVRGRIALQDAQVTFKQGSLRRHTQTDEYGMYRFEGVREGEATLVVTAPGYAERALSVVVEPVSDADWQQLPELDLQESGSVQGSVVTADGQPVPGARVGEGLIPAFLPSGEVPQGMVETDSRGRFTLPGLAPGRRILSAYSVEWGRGSAEVDVEAAERSEQVVIRLTGARPDTEPGALANLAVTLGQRGSGASAEVVVVHVAEQGEAERSGLRVGDVLLQIGDTRPRNMAEARAALAGPEGSDVVVQVGRGEETVRLRVRREAVRR